MQRLTFFLLFFCLLNPLLAQFQDNFDDGSFPNDPSWLGNTDIYVVNAANELQLMDVDAGTSQIYTPLSVADSVGWEFYCRLEFNPSTSNQLRIYLQASSPDLFGNQQGYFLQIGASGSEDALEFWRQDGSSETLLFSGSSAGVAEEPAIRVRMIRDNNANWTLAVDYSGGTNFVEEGSIMDDTYATGNYFGFTCEYSATRRDKFYFDDILIGPLQLDETPPELLAVDPLDATNLLLTFSEPLAETPAENLANYQIDNGITINSATLQTDPNQVLLDLSPMTSGTTYTVGAIDVEDLSGNASTGQQIGYTYFLLENAVAFDILFNEIFPVPDPSITNLPDAEFIELFNRSDKAISLEDFEITDRSGSKFLDAFIFPPNTYLIICDAADVDLFSGFGTVLGVPSLFTLNNQDDDLQLFNSEGILIHEINYDEDWYQDAEKSDGGWSIEQVNPNLYCQGGANWRASVAVNGGTPGQQNSVFEDEPDQTAPALLEAIALAEDRLLIRYNETMNIAAGDPSVYDIPGAGAVINAQFNAAAQEVILTIGTPFFEDQNDYTISASDLVADCSGNTIGVMNNVTFTYLATAPVAPYDIVIHEFFPDPTPAIGLPEQEFIELYNRSDKVINLDSFIISDGDKEVRLPFFLLEPDNYVLLYEKSEASFGDFGDTLALDDFVSLGNEIGVVGLLDPQGDAVHALLYDISWYRDAEKRNGGWTLEMINPQAPCQGSENWRASENGSGGTPGRANSVEAISADTQGPDLLNIYPVSDNSLVLTFNKDIDFDAASNTANYQFSEGLNATLALTVTPFNREVLVFLNAPLESGVIYELNLTDGFTDCLGNPIGLFDNGRFALPDSIEAGDIVINELLFNPASGGLRFVEFYNTSSKVLSLENLVLASRNLIDGTLQKVAPLEERYLLFPGEYVAVTAFPEDIETRYTVQNSRALRQALVPTYDSKEDIAVLYVPELLGERVIDEFPYTEDYHNALLDDVDGVSLERIDPGAPTDDPANWHSAAANVGFATPTYQNSQFFQSSSSEDDRFILPRTRFSPDEDGFEDFLLIEYDGLGGQLVNMTIFDARGRRIKDLVQNELLGQEGSFKWDGEDGAGNKARMGIYILWIELFNTDGDVEHIQKTFVLANRF